MSPSLHQRLERTFQDSFEFQSRTKKGIIRDRMFMGMFMDTLIKKGYTKGSLREAEKADLIEKKYSEPMDENGCGGYRVGYIYKGKRIDRNKILARLKALLGLIKR